MIFLVTTFFSTANSQRVNPALPAVGTIPTLIIATETFTPPFEMRASDQIYGFDIDMMNALCKIMKRTCQFKIMRFEQIIDAVAKKDVDAAISSITITTERAKRVDFTLPYLLSYSRFLTTTANSTKQSFGLLALKDKKIGVESGSIFPDQIQKMGVINPSIINYPTADNMLEALRAGSVDYLLLDNPTAVYWAANSSGAFTVVGEPTVYGYGLGIAVNPSEKDLLSAMNAALLQYQNSAEYKLNYDTYLKQF
jgi:polar amino acid transport system substrate-binding protein